jgi:hypothetical protein
MRRNVPSELVSRGPSVLIMLFVIRSVRMIVHAELASFNRLGDYYIGIIGPRAKTKARASWYAPWHNAI